MVIIICQHCEDTVDHIEGENTQVLYAAHTDCCQGKCHEERDFRR
ncbi:GapA-binding peptide SR1P [Mangrovibacillus cuniculi]|uniref:GapA-binding peptide SR1P n=1 Tax=Mangrovibacillus cuniculi TaxID=2593652 RepID=A0A7S8CA31_9BACI|nr:GapA-binding peptide SR1P [Mangrovibacillus cuniculi]QPC46195.1 GapA-binding peptide SR1P [Mangrovibacillus cuniculi]